MLLKQRYSFNFCKLYFKVMKHYPKSLLIKNFYLK